MLGPKSQRCARAEASALCSGRSLSVALGPKPHRCARAEASSLRSGRSLGVTLGPKPQRCARPETSALRSGRSLGVALGPKSQLGPKPRRYARAETSALRSGRSLSVTLGPQPQRWARAEASALRSGRNLSVTLGPKPHCCASSIVKDPYLSAVATSLLTASYKEIFVSLNLTSMSKHPTELMHTRSVAQRPCNSRGSPAESTSREIESSSTRSCRQFLRRACIT